MSIQPENSPAADNDKKNSESAVKNPVAPASPLPIQERKPGLISDAEETETYFPEDERSSMDWEDDHSLADARRSGGLDARSKACGTAAEAPLSVVSFDSGQTGEWAPLITATPLVSTPPLGSRPEEGYFPEDERSSMDWEDDHSATDFQQSGGLVVRHAPETALAARPCAGGPSPEQLEQHYFPEDERSGMDWEDDHSALDFDAEAEVRAKLGDAPLEPAPDALPKKTAVPLEDLPQVSVPSLLDGEVSTFTDDQALESDHHTSQGEDDHSLIDEVEPDHVHPGLAAALDASLAYARHGITAPGPDESSRATDVQKGRGRDKDEKDAENGNDDDEEPEKGTSARLEHEKGTSDAPADNGEESGDSTPKKKPDNDKDAEEEEDEDEEEEEAEEDRPMTLRDHLNELRKRLFRAFICVLLGFCVCYPFAEKLFDYLLIPLINVLPQSSNLIYTALPEAFFTYLKVAFVAGIFASSPLVFYQIWAFIAPGLYKEEKVYVIPIAFFSAIFFLAGGAFCFFVAFPFAFEFFMSYNTGRIQAMPSLHEYLSFVLQLILAFGLIFELPLFVFFLSRLGLVTAAWMCKMRRYAILVNVIVAAILTPPDVMSQMLMAAPLLLLYEFSILVAYFFGKKKPVPEPDEPDSEKESPLPAHRV